MLLIEFETDWVGGGWGNFHIEMTGGARQAFLNTLKGIRISFNIFLPLSAANFKQHETLCFFPPSFPPVLLLPA